MSWNHNDILLHIEVSIPLYFYRYNMCHSSFSKFSNYLMIITFLFIIAIIHHHRYDRFQKFMTTQERYDFTSFLYNVVILQSLYIFPTWHIERSTQYKARSTKHAWTWMFDISKDLFLVFFFLSFLWNLEIFLSNFSAKAHNIFKYN